MLKAIVRNPWNGLAFMAAVGTWRAVLGLWLGVVGPALVVLAMATVMWVAVGLHLRTLKRARDSARRVRWLTAVALAEEGRQRGPHL